MAEVEIHAHHESSDGYSRGVSVMVGVIGIALAFVTIGSHRAHTAAIIEKTQANDQWSFYQAKKLRGHLMEVSGGLLGALAVADTAKAAKLAQTYASEHERYEQEAKAIQDGAQAKDARSEHEETRALRLDLGEGLLELGLVLSSLYFLAKNRLFPVGGAVAAVLGTVVAITSFFV